MGQRRLHHKRVTIADLAKATGYSKAAVSFAYNDPAKISKRARELILRTAATIGYVPNPGARNFSMQQHGSIGIVLPEQIPLVLENPYIIEVIQGIAQECERSSLSLTLIPPRNRSLTEAVGKAAVDGLITLGVSAEQRVEQMIRMRGVPCVVIDGRSDTQMPHVLCDDRGSAYDLMHLVLEYGHRSIAILCMQEEGLFPSGPSRRRLQGYMQAIEEYPEPIDRRKIRQYQLGCSLQAGIEVAKTLSGVTAVICMCDITAIGCIHGLKECGIRIPEEVSVVAHDNISYSSITQPSLTTVDHPGRLKGSRAASMLLRLLEHGTLEQKQELIPYEIVHRGSLAPAGRKGLS